MRFYVAERMGIAGFVKLFFEEKSWGLVCEVETLVIDEQVRAQGIGTALMRHAEAGGARRGCDRDACERSTPQRGR